MATKSKAVLPANYQAELDKEVAEIQKRIGAPSGDMIKWTAGVGFTAPDGNQGPTMNVVILDFLSENLYYDKPYVEGEASSPACFALHREPTLLVPSDNAPAKQADTCGRCPQNEFGSSSNGKGKACRNHRLLAILPAETESIEEAPIGIIKLPPTSLKAFDVYVAGLQGRRSLPVQVVTEIGTDPTMKWANYQFKATSLLPPDDLVRFMARRVEAQQRLMKEPDVSQYQAPAPRKAVRR